MAKMGISAGGNLAKLVAVGPALLLQEFGNLGTILLSLPLALLLGLKKEAIGACYSINRDSNLGLTTDIFGPDAPETRGTFAVYIVGSVIGTVFISVLASIVASWNIFDPIALGMACGVGSGSMMTAAAGTLGEIYPQQAENIMIMGGASDMLTGITGIYMGTFVGLPLTCLLYTSILAKMRVHLFDAIDRISPAYMIGRETGDIMNIAVADIETLEYFFAHTIGPMFTAVSYTHLSVIVWMHT